MNNNATIKNAVDAESMLSDELVVKYLRENPDFFERQNDLLTELQIFYEKQGAVSLTQIQLEQYRSKVKKQKKQLDQFIENAKRNEKLYLTYADLNFAISQCESLAEVESKLAEYLCQDLGMVATQLAILDHNGKTVPELPQHSLLHKKLAKRDYYFGRLSKHEKDALFAKLEIGSVALIRIANHNLSAIIAIASADDGHFTPDMDTSLLDYLRQYLDFHLSRILK